MKRLPGVIFSAVILALGSLFQLLMAAMMVFAGIVGKSQVHSNAGVSAQMAPPTPSWMPQMMVGMAVFFVLLAAWGILTTVGLFRMQRWARYSTLVIGGCLAILGVPSMLMMLVLMFVPFPSTIPVDPAQAHTAQMAMKFGLGAVAAFYAIIAAVGISWLVYFNRKAVREAFASGGTEVLQSRRPFLISVIAVWMMIGGVCGLVMALLPIPGTLLGLIFHGWEKTVFYLVYSGVAAVAGIGLWQLKEWGRRLAIALQVVGLAQFAVYIVRPSLMTSYNAEFSQAMGVTPAPMSQQFQSTMYAVMFGFTALLLVAVVAVLHHYRKAFQEPADPGAAAPVAVA